MGGCAPGLQAGGAVGDALAEEVGALVGWEGEEAADLVAEGQFTLLLEGFQLGLSGEALFLQYCALRGHDISQAILRERCR